MTTAVIQVAGGRKKIGTLYANERRFSKTVKASKHLFKLFDAWGIDKLYFQTYLLPRNYKIEVYDSESKRLYTTDAETFHKFGIYHDFGHKPQVFLPRQHWHIKGEGEKYTPGLF